MHSAENIIARNPLAPTIKRSTPWTQLIRVDSDEAHTLPGKYFGKTPLADLITSSTITNATAVASAPTISTDTYYFQSFGALLEKPALNFTSCVALGSEPSPDARLGCYVQVLLPSPRADVAGAGDQKQWRGVSNEIDAIERLIADWDADGAVKPDQKLVEQLRDVLGKLQGMNAPAPSEAFAVGDGEIGLRWRTADTFASASFLPDGCFLASVRSPRLPNRFSLDAVWESRPSLRPFVRALLER